MFVDDPKSTHRVPCPQLEVVPGRYGESTIVRILQCTSFGRRGAGIHKKVTNPSPDGQFFARGRGHPLQQVA
jgi:hypothetical protein